MSNEPQNAVDTIQVGVYKTRAGRRAIVTKIYEGNDHQFPAHGTLDGTWASWSLTGHFDNETYKSQYDLIEIWK